MIENFEVEYKTMVSNEELTSLMEYFPGNKPIIQTNYYYQSKDNPKKVFRIRKINGKYLFTYKHKQKNGRLEYETLLDSLDLDNKEINDVLDNFGFNKPYLLIATLQTKRLEIKLPDEANLCFDINNYYGITDYEIEYEITGKNGSLKNFKEILKIANIEYKKAPFSKQKRAIMAANQQQ